MLKKKNMPTEGKIYEEVGYVDEQGEFHKNVVDNPQNTSPDSLNNDDKKENTDEISDSESK